jgi:hypothetical protein
MVSRLRERARIVEPGIDVAGEDGIGRWCVHPEKAAVGDPFEGGLRYCLIRDQGDDDSRRVRPILPVGARKRGLAGEEHIRLAQREPKRKLGGVDTHPAESPLINWVPVLLRTVA